MKNTVLKNIISNFDLMAKDHFLDWFEENKEVLLEKEKKQIIDAAKHGANFDNSPYINTEDYYNETFKK